MRVVRFFESIFFSSISSLRFWWRTVLRALVSNWMIKYPRKIISKRLSSIFRSVFQAHRRTFEFIVPHWSCAKSNKKRFLFSDPDENGARSARHVPGAYIHIIATRLPNIIYTRARDIETCIHLRWIVVVRLIVVWSSAENQLAKLE